MSREKAKSFFNQAAETTNIQNIHVQINDLIDEQKSALDNLSGALSTLFEQTQRVQQHNPLTPYELVLEQPSAKLNQSIGNLNLWQNTGATVIGILHNEDLIV